MKYSNHVQKFENADPQLQEQWKHLKEVLCDNEHLKYYKIMIGRKINFKSILEVWTSPSIELTNFWSHFLFGIYFLIRGFSFSGRFFVLNLLTALTYLMSSVYHTFRSFSRKLFDLMLCFDVSGIAIQVLTYNFVDTISFFGGIRDDLVKNYVICHGLLSLFTYITIPILLYNKLYTCRTVLICFVAMSGYFLIYHAYLIFGFTEKIQKLLFYRIVSFSLQGVGIFFRGSHIPERFLPDTIFQKFFHSHFWFHIVAAIGSIYACMSSEVLM